MTWAIVALVFLVLNVLIVAWFAKKKPVQHTEQKPDTTKQEALVDDELRRRVKELEEANHNRLLDELRKLRR